MKVTGLNEVQAKFAAMGKKAESKYLKEALREGAKPVLAAEKGLIHNVKGLLSREPADSCRSQQQGCRLDPGLCSQEVLWFQGLLRQFRR